MNSMCNLDMDYFIRGKKMNIIEKFNNFIYEHNCVFCKYKKYNTENDSCLDHMNYGEECKSISNIYHGTICKFFPFKQIDNFIHTIQINKENKYQDEMDKKYGDCSLENDDLKFIWGIKSFDDLSSNPPCLYSMNDIDIVYDKHDRKYLLGVETAYMFKNHKEECYYLMDCLDAFTRYMDENNLQKDKEFMLFMSNTCTSLKADSIEELYVNFKIFVNGFTHQDIPMLKEYC